MREKMLLMHNYKKYVSILIVLCLMALCSCFYIDNSVEMDLPYEENAPYVVIGDNIPSFTDEQITNVSFEKYSELDFLGRCGTAVACIGRDIMPTEERESIGQVKPSGWQIAKYDFIDGKYLYNRCHLIGYQLTGENANEKNLITGTRYMNTEGMLPFENMVREYVEETGNHVMYRVTPVFEGENLVASGVLMEALSVEDNGKGISYNVYVFNKQPGVEIDYSNGSNTLSENTENMTYENKDDVNNNAENNVEMVYVLNNSSFKFHAQNCSAVDTIKEKNKEIFKGTRKYLIENGYLPCGACNP